MILDELLEYEKNSKVLSFQFQYKKTLVWPFIRFDIFRFICDSNSNLNLKKVSSKMLPLKYENIIEKLIYNPYFSLPHNIMYIYQGGINVIKEDGTVFNRLVDDYAKIFSKQTYLLEGKSTQRLCKRNQRNINNSDFISNLIDCNVSKINTNQKDKEMCNKFITYLIHTLPFEMNRKFWQTIERRILLYSKQIIFYDKYYRLLFSMIRPKIVIMEDACFGGAQAYILRLLKDLKIPSAEIQHGWVGKTHEAYNYSNLICNSETYKDYMPQYFLAYGEYWLNKINLPVKKLVIGSPVFTMNKVKIDEIKCKNHILLIMSEHNDCLKLLEKLMPLLESKYFLELRLHPLELNSSRWYTKFNKYKNFKIVTSGIIYDSINRAEYVVGDFSTALFEAAALGKKVLVYANEYAKTWEPEEISIQFETVEQLLQIMKEDKGCKVVSNTIFDTNWKANYKKFIKSF